MHFPGNLIYLLFDDTRPDHILKDLTAGKQQLQKYSAGAVDQSLWKINRANCTVWLLKCVRASRFLHWTLAQNSPVFLHFSGCQQQEFDSLLFCLEVSVTFTIVSNFTKFSLNIFSFMWKPIKIRYFMNYYFLNSLSWEIRCFLYCKPVFYRTKWTFKELQGWGFFTVIYLHLLVWFILHHFVSV